MRKSIYFSAAVFLAITLFFVLSCSKEETKSETENQPAQTSYDQQVTNVIKNFKEKVAYHRENPGYKSGESVSADSALWLLEATINFSHGFPNENYDELFTEDLTLAVSKNGNREVDMDVLMRIKG